MENLYRRKLNKIYNKINNLALKGRDNQIEYLNYIDELIDKGDYSAFEEVMFVYYDFDINKPHLKKRKLGTRESRRSDVESYKYESWKLICEKTKSSFLTELSKLYKAKGVYQISFDIFRESNNDLLGSILEKEEFGGNTNYYIKNKQYARLIGERKTFIEVMKDTDINPTLIDEVDPNLTELQNLYTRYKNAIEYLLS